MALHMESLRISSMLWDAPLPSSRWLLMWSSCSYPSSLEMSSLYLLWNLQKPPAWPGDLDSSLKPLCLSICRVCGLARARLPSPGSLQSRSRRHIRSPPTLSVPSSHDPCQTTGTLEKELLRRNGNAVSGHIQSHLKLLQFLIIGLPTARGYSQGQHLQHLQTGIALLANNHHKLILSAKLLMFTEHWNAGVNRGMVTVVWTILFKSGSLYLHSFVPCDFCKPLRTFSLEP